MGGTLIVMALVAFVVWVAYVQISVRGHKLVDTSLTQDEVYAVFREVFGGRSWALGEEHGDLLARNRLKKNGPTIAVSVEHVGPGKRTAEVWVRQWETKYGVMAHAQFAWRKIRAFTKAVEARSAPPAAAAPALPVTQPPSRVPAPPAPAPQQPREEPATVPAVPATAPPSTRTAPPPPPPAPAALATPPSGPRVDASVPTTCGGCGAGVQAGDHFCDGCGAPISRTSTPALTTSSCPQCGAAAPTMQDQFCEQCGHELRQTEAAEASRSLARPNSEPGALPPWPPPKPATTPVVVWQPAFDAESMQALIGVDWCRSCGATVIQGPEVCPSCQASRAPLASAVPTVAGLVYEIRRGLTKRRAVRLDGGGDTATVLVRDERVTIPAATLPQALPSDTTDHLAASGRLVARAAAVRDGHRKEAWPVAALLEAAVSLLGEDPVEARRLAVDLIDYGFAEDLTRLPLSTSEQAWLRAVALVRAGRPSDAVEVVRSLQPDRYAGKVAIIAAAWPDLAVDQRKGLIPHLDPFMTSSPLAAAMLTSVGSPDDVELVLAAAEQLLDVMPSTGATGRARAVAALAGGAAPERLEEPASMPARLLAGRQGLLRPTETDLAVAPRAFVDDLLEEGNVDEATVLAAAAGDDHAYFAARLDPNLLSMAELEGVGHVDEIVRRLFVAGEGRRLGQFAPQDERAAQYVELLKWRRGDVAEASVEALLPEYRHAGQVFVDVVQAAQAGGDLAEVLEPDLLADPSLWPVLVEVLGEARVVPSEALMARHREFCEWLCLHQAKLELQRHRWQGAIDYSRFVLRLQPGEAVRDEVLNLMACGHHQLGNAEAAMSALEQAIEGEYSEALLANIGVVAEDLAPEKAARYLGRLASEAPTTTLRIAAARRAIDIWQRAHDSSSWSGGDDGGLPAVLAEPFHSLVVEEIPLEDFRALLRLLWQHDRAWLAKADLTRSPHRSTVECRYYKTKATDLWAVIDILAEEGRRNHATLPPWLAEERDEMVGYLLGAMRTGDEADLGLGIPALQFVEKHVPMGALERIELTVLGIGEVALGFRKQDESIDDRFVPLLVSTRTEVLALPETERERLAGPLGFAFVQMAITVVGDRAPAIDQLAEHHDQLLDAARHAPPGSPARLAVVNCKRRLLDLCRSSVQLVTALRPGVPEGEVSEGVKAFIKHYGDMQDRLQEML